MIKKFFLLLTLIPSIKAMEMEDANIPQWVKAATTIQVTSLKMDQTVPINNRTTILDIKNVIFDRDGIPTDQAQLRAQEPKLVIFKTISEELADDANVKSIMHVYNTNCLSLYLKLNTARNNS